MHVSLLFILIHTWFTFFCSGKDSNSAESALFLFLRLLFLSYTPFSQFLSLIFVFRFVFIFLRFSVAPFAVLCSSFADKDRILMIFYFLIYVIPIIITNTISIIVISFSSS